MINLSKKNICKFFEPISFDRLIATQFVHETDKSVYSNETKLIRNRAILVSVGTGDFYFSDKKFSYGPGNLIFGFEGETMKCISKEDTEYMYINFEGLRCNELFHRFNITSTTRVFSGFDGMVPLWFESISRAEENSIDLVCESMLLYAFSRIIKNVDANNYILEQMYEITDKSFTDSKLSLTTISQELSYNPKYLSHLFKNKVGIGYNEYLRNLRVKFAISLFDSGLDSVKNVAALSGYPDALYFSTVFKKIVGITPTEYINNKKE